MAAQNDDVSTNSAQDLTYPNVAGDTSLQTNSTVVAADPNSQISVVPSADVSRGEIVSGPPIIGDPIVESPAQAPLIVQQPPLVDENEPAKIEEESDNGVDSAQKPEKKSSPLQSLAKKLAELKSELIEDTPEQPPVDAVAPSNQEVPNVASEITDIGNSGEVPAIDSPSEASAANLIDETVSTDPVQDLQADTAEVADSSSDLPDDGTLQIGDELSQSPTPVSVDINTPQDIPDSSGPVSPTPVSSSPSSLEDIMPDAVISEEQQVVQAPGEDENKEVEVPGLSIEEASSKENNDSLVNTGPEALMDIGQNNEVQNTSEVPVTQADISMSDPNTLDEADNSVVPTSVVSSKSSEGGKYPLTIAQVLETAIERQASDVQISVGYPVMIRIDGTLIAINDQIVSSANAEELILPVLSEQKKELLEVNREVDLAYTHENGLNARFRINAYYTRQNLAAAFRLIPSKIKTIEDLQLPPIYNQFAAMKQGLILVTGPTGHGKSTTLAAILQAVNTTRSAHMVTIEDPIEYIFPKSKAVIDQREMHDDTHSWTIALKSALRQDPDVMLVGEMRDYETIAATVTLAETGHLVFATLHTNSASQTIDRIIDVFPENQQAQIRAQLANILEAVIAQRLLPLEGGGRRAVSEIMLGTPAIRNLIREGKTHQIDNVIRTSADVGMVSLEHSLVKLVREGLITSDKAQEYAVHPEEVVRLLKN